MLQCHASYIYIHTRVQLKLFRYKVPFVSGLSSSSSLSRLSGWIACIMLQQRGGKMHLVIHSQDFDKFLNSRPLVKKKKKAISSRYVQQVRSPPHLLLWLSPAHNEKIASACSITIHEGWMHLMKLQGLPSWVGHPTLLNSGLMTWRVKKKSNMTKYNHIMTSRTEPVTLALARIVICSLFPESRCATMSLLKYLCMEQLLGAYGPRTAHSHPCMLSHTFQCSYNRKH